MAINILDSVIANRISAGEVVEKPASIVKELMDNALDAGATEIYVDIVNGGIDQISIQDNGCGIEPDDIKKAFLPHATSKISCIEDLDNIATLGFRGEALASISSVAQVTMVTKTKDLDYASTISVNGGVFGAVGATASQNGTYIEVRNLFFNTPARRKFLRRPKTEESEITNFISRYILAHPDIKIRYSANEKVIFDNKGGDLLNAIACVYGADILPHLAFKANITSRIALTVSSQIDSRTIIDGSGAESLLGRGDMLFKPYGSDRMLRIQGSFVSEKEINDVVSYIKKNETPEYDQQVIEEIEKQATKEKSQSAASDDASDGDAGDTDPMLRDAIECVIDNGQASTSLLQRKLKVGYARAARIIDEMEERGIVSGYEGSKPRKVLITRDQWVEMNMRESE